MSLVVICMALLILATQNSWPTGGVLILIAVTLVPATIVDILIFVAISHPRYGNRSVVRKRPIKRKSISMRNK